LDVAGSAGGEDVILEIGGGSTKAVTKQDETKEESPITKSEKWKLKGNDHFKCGSYLEAYDMYTAAIQACPGMTGDQLLEEKTNYEKKKELDAMEAHRKKMEAPTNTEQKRENEGTPQQQQYPEQYKAPMHVHGEKLATYHSNRAAVCLHLNRYEDVIRDCDIALLLNPSYAKVYMRRCTAYEQTDRTEEALRDAKVAYQLAPSNPNTKKTMDRLQKVEDERLEQLKEETIGKLKDLGNSILGNFGISLDNFKAVQGADGSYNINFNQTPK